MFQDILVEANGYRLLRRASGRPPATDDLASDHDVGLVQATEWPQAVGTTALIAGAGALFYFMVKAMARIQMPRRPSSE